jgi:hypothetical protein
MNGHIPQRFRNNTCVGPRPLPFIQNFAVHHAIRFCTLLSAVSAERQVIKELHKPSLITNHSVINEHLLQLKFHLGEV